MKQKLLLALLALFTLGGSNLCAQDVTATYIMNADFEGEYSSTSNPKPDRDIYQPTSWTVTYTNGNENDMTSLNSSCTQWNQFSGKPQPSNGGNNTYWIRERWGKGQSIKLSQNATLPAGNYVLSADAYINSTSATATISVANQSTNISTKNSWQSYRVSFTLDEETEVTVAMMLEQKSEEESIAAFDNFRLICLSGVTSNDPYDMTSWIVNPSFELNTFNGTQAEGSSIGNSGGTINKPTGWTCFFNVEGWRDCSSNTTAPADGNYCMNAWFGTIREMKFYQTINDLPEGIYEISAKVRTDQTETTGIYTYGVVGESTYKSASWDASQAATTWNSMDNWQTLTARASIYGGGSLEFGLRTDKFVQFDDFHLTYLGSDLLLAESQAAWTTAHSVLAALDATLLPDAAEAAITEELAKTCPATYAEIGVATAALQALIDSYEGIKAAYNEYKALKDKVENLKNKNFTGADALLTFNTTLYDINTNAEAATDAETLTNLLPSMKTAGNTFVGAIESLDDFDLTYNIENNSFETGALSPWTTNGSNDTGVKPNSNGTYTTTGVDGAYLFNTWNNGAGSKVSQTLSNLPKGYYTVTALVASDAGNSINILAGATTKAVEADETNGKNQFVEGTTDKVLVSNGSLEIGTNSSTWYKADNFRLTFYTETAGARDAWLAAKAAAKAARDDAAYDNVTGEERTALQAEIDKAEPSSAVAYGTATTALQEKTSAFIAAKDSYDAFVAAQAIETPELKYARNDKKNALNDAKTATATSATDADTKTAAIITALRAYYESNAAAEGVNGAEDLTSKLTNAKNQSNTNGWTVNNTTGNCNLRTMSNEPYTYADGTTATGYLDTNSWGSAFESSVTQNVELYAGKYILSVKARGAETTIYQLTANGVTADITAAGNTGGVFDRGWNGYTVEFELEETGSVALGVNFAGEKWLSFGDFQLVQLELYTQMATDEDYAALNEAISAAEANLGFEDGQYAPYNNIEALTKLAEAKAIDQAANNEQETVQALTTYLTTTTNWTANSGDVDAIYNGTFAETGTGSNPKGWTRSNNGWGQQITGLTAEENGVNEGTSTAWYYNNNGAWQYGNDGVYTMPLAAETTYMLTFKYAKHGNDGNNWMKASVLINDNEGLEVQYPGATDNTLYQKATAYFKTGAAGNYILSIEQNGNAHLTDVSLVKAESATKNFDEASTTYTPELAYYETVSLTRSLQAGDKWNTFCVPFDMEIPDGWTVKEFNSAQGNTINFTNAKSIVAGNPYIVKLTEAVTNPTYSNVVVKSTEGETMGQGDYKFAAQIYNKPLATDGSIAYMTTSGQIKKLTSGGIKGLRAYFIMPANGESARIHFVEEDETTGIDAIDGVIVENGNIYDLQGRKVETMKRGIYIVNGKKVVIK